MKAILRLHSRAITASLFFAFCAFPAFTAEDSAKELFTWDLLWTGSWYKSIRTPEGEFPPSEDIFHGGTLFNHGSLTLGFNQLDLSLRLLVTDKRVLPPVEDDSKAGFNPAMGIYHQGSGSRFLYGVQSDFGLPARINNIWLRSVPFMESRQPSSRDLKPEPAAKDTADTYLYLSLPQNILPGFDVFASAAMDSDQNPTFGGGLGWHALGPEIRVEGFYAAKDLAPRDSSAWFSASPPLPERDFNIYALTLFFHSANASFATDWAWSETFAWGKGLYGNFSLRMGNRPWRFSLAGDGVGGRFADRSGAITASGFRLAARGERFWPRSGLLRFQTNLRSSGLEEAFDRGSLSIYYRPSAPTAAERRESTSVIRFTRSSLSLNRDARNPQKANDTLNALAGFNMGPFTTVFSFALKSNSWLGEENEHIFQYPLFESFESFRIGGELGWKAQGFRIFSGAGASNFDLRTRLGYTIRAEKDPFFDFSVNGSFRPGRWGRISLRVACTEFPEKWNYTLSWRFETR